MSWLEERRTAQARFRAEWTEGGELKTPVAWPNKAEPQVSDEPWVRFSVQSGPAAQVSVGSSQNLYRHDGDVVVEIFTPRDQGELAALELADDAAAIYRGLREGELRFFTPRITDARVVDGWWKVDVISGFERDTRFAPATPS